MSRAVRPYSVLVAILAVCLFAAVGYRIGQTARVSASDAASAWGNAAASAYPQARTKAYSLAWQRSYRLGASAGAAVARRAATTAGNSAGRSLAAVRAVAARALAAALASAPVTLPKQLKTDRCVPIAGGLCEVLGPTVTGKRCPRSSVPNIEGGIVCVPRVLLLALRGASPSGAEPIAP